MASFLPPKKIHQWEASAETVTPDLVKDFFDYFGEEGGQTLCNFYGSTEMMDVTFAAFRSADDASGLVLDGKVSSEYMDSVDNLVKMFAIGVAFTPKGPDRAPGGQHGCLRARREHEAGEGRRSRRTVHRLAQPCLGVRGRPGISNDRTTIMFEA